MVGEIRVVVVGDTDVGKSSLINTHCPPITGIQDASIARVGGVAFVLCDTFGAQRFRTLTSGFYRYARGVLIVYDVADRETFLHVPQWMSEVRLRTHAAMPVVVVANKCDVAPAKRLVSRDEGMRLCADMEVGYTETSALLSSAASCGSAADDSSGALVNALSLLLDRMPQAPAATAESKLSTDKKHRRHRSMMVKPGQQFVLPPVIKDAADSKKKKRGCFAAMRRRSRARDKPTPPAASLTRRNEVPIYTLGSVYGDAPQKR